MVESIPRWLRLCVPTSLTLVNLACGVVGAAVVTRWFVAGSPPDGVALFVPLALMLVALVADGLDGAVARRMGVATRFGRRLDQVADGVTSALMPGWLVFVVAFPQDAIAGSMLAVAYVGAGVARLVVQPDRVGRCKTRSVGLPLPVAAAVVLGNQVVLAWFLNREPAPDRPAIVFWIVGVITLLHGGLMLTRLRYPSPGLIVRWLRIHGRRNTVWLLLVALTSLTGLPMLVAQAWCFPFYWYAGQPIRRRMRRLTPAWLKLDLTPARSPSSASRSAR